MSIKTYRPTTPARRQMTVSGFDGVDKHAKPERSLIEVRKKNSGRNSYGRITVRHKGGGNRRKYRIIDFKRDKLRHDRHRSPPRVRPEPQRLHRPRPVRGRREALHPRPRWHRRRRHRCVQHRRRHQAGQLPAAREHPGRHCYPQHRALSRPRRPARPLRRRGRPAHG